MSADATSIPRTDTHGLQLAAVLCSDDSSVKQQSSCAVRNAIVTLNDNSCQWIKGHVKRWVP